MRLRYWVLMVLAFTALMSSCTYQQTQHWRELGKPTHNEHGGYIEACGDLPPLIGDDC